MHFDLDQRLRSTFGFVLTMINDQDRLWMYFDQDQQLRSTFGCVLSMINSQDQLFDVFLPRSMVKIDFWMCFDQDQLLIVFSPILTF